MDRKHLFSARFKMDEEAKEGSVSLQNLVKGSGCEIVAKEKDGGMELDVYGDDECYETLKHLPVEMARTRKFA